MASIKLRASEHLVKTDQNVDSCCLGLEVWVNRNALIRAISFQLTRPANLATENPKANLEVPYHGPTQRWQIQLCLGPAPVLGDSRVARRRQRKIVTNPFHNQS